MSMLTGAGVDQWREMVASTFVPLETMPTDRPFRGAIKGGKFGVVQVCEISATPHVVRRTRRLIKASDDDYYKVGLQLDGCTTVAQDGRQAALLPGDIAVYDSTRPYQLTSEADFRMLVLMFPRRLLRIGAARAADITATRIATNSGTGRIVVGFLLGLAEGLGVLHERAAARLADTAIDLIGVLLDGQSDFPCGDGARQALLTRVHGFIDANLSDPGLSPEAIARAHHVSTRYLHKLFEAEERSVAGRIRQRRLEQCRRDLADPAQRHRSVSAIAADWGLMDAAHFSKLFKAHFGTAPRDYRTDALAQPLGTR